MCLIKKPSTAKSTDAFVDITNHIYEWIVIIILGFIWLMVTFVFDVPGCGKGYLGPGGIGDQGAFWNCTGGAAGYVDQQIFGINHIYQTPTCRDTYITGPYEPEGFMGFLTSIIMTYLGLQAGRVLIYYKSHSQRLIRWGFWALALGIITLGLCNGKLNGGTIPINKNLWSLSFIFAQSCTGFISLSICYILVDVLKYWNGSPFRYIGMNSILLYTLHEVFDGYFPFHYQLSNEQKFDHWAPLTENLLGTSCWLFVAYYFYTIDFFVKI